MSTLQVSPRIAPPDLLLLLAGGLLTIAAMVWLTVPKVEQAPPRDRGPAVSTGRGTSGSNASPSAQPEQPPFCELRRTEGGC